MLWVQHKVVRLLRTMLTLLLAVVWIPLTAHCQLEKLTGLEVLRCSCAGTGAVPGDSHRNGGTCCGWESGQYLLPPSQPVIAVPLLAVVSLVVATVENRAPAQVSAIMEAEPLPGPPKPWQFCLRAALPVRAPSIAS